MNCQAKKLAIFATHGFRDPYLPTKLPVIVGIVRFFTVAA
jgi:hypothetical protein